MSEQIAEPITVSMQTEGMVALMVEPRLDNAVAKLGDEIIHINLYAQQLVIAGDSDMVRATNDLLLISKLKKAIEAKRKEYVSPLLDHTKAINEFFRFLTAPLDTADKTVNDKVLAYRQTIEAKRREEERINALRLEAAQAEMKLKGELTEPVSLVEVSPAALSKVRTDLGSMGVVKVRKYRVVNFAELPDQYKIENSALLNKVVKAGIPSISGVEIYSEDSLRVTPSRS